MEELPQQTIDCSKHFILHKNFQDREKLIEEVKHIGEQLNIFITICRSTKGYGSKSGSIWLSCERFGGYRMHKNKHANVAVRNRTGSKKCHCPFMLKGVEQDDGHWTLIVVNGNHNHPLEKYTLGHSRLGKLKDEEFKIVATMTESNVKPQQILNHLKRQNPENLSSGKHVYNARQKLKNQKKNGCSVVEKLLKLLIDHGYQHWCRDDAETNTVSALFFAHPDSIRMLNVYPYVLLMDSTFKTSRCLMPLCEVIAVAPMGTLFSVAFIFLKSENKESYTWALEHLRSLIDSKKFPTTIITDRKLALINGLKIIFPNSYHILCKRHIGEDVENYCTNMENNNEIGTSFSHGHWHKLVEAQTQPEYDDRRREMHEAHSNKKDLLIYVDSTWLIPFKERFVLAWTNCALHMGQLTIYREEAAHLELKSYLESSVVSFDSIWFKIDSVINSQLNEIKSELARARTISLHDTALMYLFQRLDGNVIKKAIQLIEEECKRVEKVRNDTLACGCYLRKTHGLPCAHELFKFMQDNRSIDLQDIHPFWKTLGIDGVQDSDSEENKTLQSMFDFMIQQPLNVKRRCIEEFKKIVPPEWTSLKEQFVGQTNEYPKK